MLGFAAVGLLANLVSLRLLHGPAPGVDEHARCLPRGVRRPGGVGARRGRRVVSLTTGFTRADPVASLVIAALVLPRSFTLLRDAVEVLLETAPAHLDLDDVRDHLQEKVPGVLDVHDLHAWTLTSGIPCCRPTSRSPTRCWRHAASARCSTSSARCVAEHFEVEHATFQVEPGRPPVPRGPRPRARLTCRSAPRPRCWLCPDRVSASRRTPSATSFVSCRTRLAASDWSTTARPLSSTRDLPATADRVRTSVVERVRHQVRSSPCACP